MIKKITLKWIGIYLSFILGIFAIDTLVDEYIREGNDVFILVIGFAVASYCINRYEEEKQ